MICSSCAAVGTVKQEVTITRGQQHVAVAMCSLRPSAVGQRQQRRVDHADLEGSPSTGMRRLSRISFDPGPCTANDVNVGLYLPDAFHVHVPFFAELFNERVKTTFKPLDVGACRRGRIGHGWWRAGS